VLRIGPTQIQIQIQICTWNLLYVSVKLSKEEALQQCIEKMTEQSGSTALLTGLEAVKLESIPTNAKTCLYTVSQSHANAFF
jgi:hypothetical protein